MQQQRSKLNFPDRRTDPTLTAGTFPQGKPPHYRRAPTLTGNIRPYYQTRPGPGDRVVLSSTYCYGIIPPRRTLTAILHWDSNVHSPSTNLHDLITEYLTATFGYCLLAFFQEKERITNLLPK